NELIDQLMAFMMRLTLLPQMAWSMVDATVRSLCRVYLSRRHLLEWTTTDAVASRRHETPTGYLALMRGGLALGLGFIALVAALRPDNLAPALAIGVLWLGAPLIAWVSARPIERE